MMKFSLISLLSGMALARFAENQNSLDQPQQKLPAAKLNELWDGKEDIISSTYFAAGNPTALVGIPGLPVVDENTQMGMFDSGTNLMRVYWTLNFGAPDVLPFWKHAPPMKQELGGFQELLDEKLAQLKLQNRSVVATVRNPISHMVSWKKCGYSLVGCTNKQWSDIMTSPCQFKYVQGYPEEWPLASFEAPGLVNVWNEYTRGYLELAEKHDNLMVIRYEDLVSDPEKTIKAFAKFAGFKVPHKIVHVESPAKDHGNPAGREASLSKIEEHEYLYETHHPIVDFVPKICENIDWSIVKDIPKLVESVPDYDSDCPKSYL
eukprot:CAMPEP_0184483688 /NCGR_PEP_ID=MMETSP0113_2-20130426/5367_1 /TAXON_ID=91329 /ORGANISM="Norrisiella sphaerica, Strain BC52" /LENGTH=319 /DNA_ID=CAMNT_0026864247 /DNA_START=99 /DNA_END=1058 /DNA_ORIENTATION=-